MTDSFQRHRPGLCKPSTTQREFNLRLMRHGLTNAEACRQAGINIKTAIASPRAGADPHMTPPPYLWKGTRRGGAAQLRHRIGLALRAHHPKQNVVHCCDAEGFDGYGTVC